MKRLTVTWALAVGMLVLAARWLAYALAAPSPLGNRLEGSAGGPSLVVVTLVALGLAAALSVFVVWLVAVGVGERQRLQPERVRPELRLHRLALRAVLLCAVSSLAFSCLVGPVHRNAIPLLAALSLAAAAIAEAAAHVVGWMRAVLRALARRPFVFAPLDHPAQLLVFPFVPAHAGSSRPRAPPVPA